VIERVGDVRVVDAVPTSARCDRRFTIHCSKVTCSGDTTVRPPGFQCPEVDLRR
jgi:hypothetical protein